MKMNHESTRIRTNESRVFAVRRQPRPGLSGYTAFAVCTCKPEGCRILARIFHRRFADDSEQSVAQVSKPAVSRISKSAECPQRLRATDGTQVWKPATQQTRRSALHSRHPRGREICASGFLSPTLLYVSTEERARPQPRDYCSWPLGQYENFKPAASRRSGFRVDSCSFLVSELDRIR